MDRRDPSTLEVPSALLHAGAKPCGESVMGFWKRAMSAAALAVAMAVSPLAARADDKPIDVIFVLPAPTLTFSAPFLAEDAGLYKKEGLNATHRMLVGVEAVNAVIA